MIASAMGVLLRRALRELPEQSSGRNYEGPSDMKKALQGSLVTLLRAYGKPACDQFQHRSPA